MPNPVDPLRPQDDLPAQSLESESLSSADEADAAEPQLLNQVMSQTLASLTSTRELNPQVFAALLEVARHYAGEPLSLDPVAIALVGASLQVQFPALASRESLSRRMNIWVAESILDDPAARHRLAELWARLGEALA